MLLIAASSVLPSVAAGAGRESTVSPFQFDRALAAAIDKGLRAASFEDEEPQVKRVYVKCYRDASAFEEPLQPRFGIARPETRALTAYYAGGGELHLRNGSCANARLFAAGVMRWDTAAAFSVLLHEALHRQGIDGERATTCLGNDAVRWAAVALGYPDRKADRARLLAFQYSARSAPAGYRMTRFRCLHLVSGQGLSWWKVSQAPWLEKRFG